MTEPGSTFILRFTMAESGSPQRSSDSDDEYNLTLSSSLSSENSEEVCLSWASLEMEVLYYRRFEPDLSSTDVDGSVTSVYPSAASPEIEALYVDCVGNTDC